MKQSERKREEKKKRKSAVPFSMITMETREKATVVRTRRRKYLLGDKARELNKENSLQRFFFLGCLTERGWEEEEEEKDQWKGKTTRRPLICRLPAP